MSMCQNLLEVYNAYLRETNPERNVIYYQNANIHEDFNELNFEDIKEYFKTGNKSECIPEEMTAFFTDTKDGQRRTKHMFAVYLLGIYVYDHVFCFKKAFESFIKNKIWKFVKNEKFDEDVRNDFLYLWYLTALYHDIGYPNGKLRLNDNSLYSQIINQKTMMHNQNLGYQNYILGIPQKIRLTSKEYFWQRRNNIYFNDNLCTDHGFVGGYRLFKSLRKIHLENCDTNNNIQVRPYNDNSLLFGEDIFKWYNVPCAWAIICHNIWLAKAGTGMADKYEQLGLSNLIYCEGDSPIKYKSHPLLFLLDFVDTVGFEKRFGCDNLDKVIVSSTEDSISFLMPCDCIFTKLFLQRIKSDSSYLESNTFHISIRENEANAIDFKFE